MISFWISVVPPKTVFHRQVDTTIMTHPHTGSGCCCG